MPLVSSKGIVYNGSSNNPKRSGITIGEAARLRDSVSNPRSSYKKVANASDRKKYSSPYKHQWSYDDRYQYALDNGLSPANAKVWASQKYSSVSDSFWSKAGAFFGGKLNSEKFAEENELADSSSFNQLLEAQRQQEYNDPAAEISRRQAAGLNDAITGGSEIGAGDSGAVEDQTIGAGLPEAMQALNGEGSDFMSIAETLMNGATSILGLVSGGVNLSSDLMGLDNASLNNVLGVVKDITDLGYDPLSPKFGEFMDDDGNVNWHRYFNSLGIRSHRERKVLKRILSAQSQNTKLHSNAVGNRADILKHYRDYSDEYATLTGRGNRVPAFGSDGYNFGYESELQSLVTNDTYSKYVNNVASFIQSQMEGQAKEQQFKSAYYSAVSAGKKAEAENALNDFNKVHSELKMSAAQQVNAQINELIKLSNQGDWMATLLLQSAISGSFNEFGLGNPYDLPKFGVEQVGNIAGALTKGIFGMVPKTTKVLKGALK